MKTAQKIGNNLINLNIFPLKVSSLRRDVWYLRITNLWQNMHFRYKILQYTCFSWTYYTCSYVIFGIRHLNLIVNMQDFRYWLCTSILDCFGQPVSPLYSHGQCLCVSNTIRPTNIWSNLQTSLLNKYSYQ